MKKIFILTSLLICAIMSFAQGPFPLKQSLGSPSTLLKSNGAFKDSLAHILATWPDTTSANANPYIKFYPGAQIRTITPANTVWLRNANATGWLPMATGVLTNENFANTNLTFTGNRVHTLGSYFMQLLSNDGGGNTTDVVQSPGELVQTINSNTIQGAVLLNQTSSIFSHSNSSNSESSFLRLTEGIATLSATDSIRVVGVDESASTGLYYPLINPATGALTRIAAGDIGGSEFGWTDTFFLNNRYVNENNKTFKWKNGNVTVAAKDSVGNWIDYSWATTPLNTAVFSSSGTAPTTNGVTTTINGTTTLTSVKKTGVENFTIRFSAITNVKTSAVQSISALILPDTIASLTTRKITWVLADTAGYINFFRNDGATTPLASNRGYQQLLWAALDTFDFEFIFSPQRAISTMTNRANGQKSYFEYTLNASIGNVGSVQLIASGNFTLLGNFTYEIGEVRNPDFVPMGNSTAAGSGATSFQYRWENQAFRNYSNTWVVEAGGGERSANALLRMPEIIYAINPGCVIWEYGVNDMNGGSIALFSQNARRFADSMNAHGICMIWMSLVPQTANVAIYNDTIQAIAAAKGGKYINITTTLQAGSGDFNKNNLYKPSAADQVHLNNTGMQIQASIVTEALNKSRGLSQVPGFTVGSIPISSKFSYYLAKDEKNNIVSIPAGSDTGYILNKQMQSGETLANGQPGGFFLQGQGLIGTDFYVVGSGTPSNASFRVVSGTTTIGTLVSGNLSQGGGVTSVTSNYLQWLNGAYIRSVGSNMLPIRTSIAAVGQGSTGIHVTTEGNQPGPSFIPFAVGTADTIKVAFDRFGGAVFNHRGEAAAMFRVEGDTDTAAFVVNAATDKVGIGLLNPISKFHVVGSIRATDSLNIGGHLQLGTAGSKIFIATGSNASIGVSGAMTAGTITISTTAVTTNSKIFLTHAIVGGTQGILSVGTIVNGTSFVINSSSATDTGSINYWIIN